jgi:hypothetical protein
MKSAQQELGEMRSLLSGDAWSREVLTSRFMKRKTLLCCAGDPQKPVRGSELGVSQHTLRVSGWGLEGCVGVRRNLAGSSGQRHNRRRYLHECGCVCCPATCPHT